MPFLSNKSLAGPGYIILNVLRAMNVIGLLAVATASVVMLVKTFIVSKFFFFDACSHVVTALCSIFLVVSEAGVFQDYFSRNWPLLSPAHGFVALGGAMLVIGINTLGNLNKEATSQKSLGMGFWRIVIGSGIIIIVLGFFNIIASYVFRDTRVGLTARHVRAHGAVAESVLPTQEPFKGSASSSSTPYPSDKKTPPLSIRVPSSHYSTDDHLSPSKQQSQRSPFKMFSPVRAFRAARDSLPSYSFTARSKDDVRGNAAPEAGKKGKEGGIRRTLNISSPLNINPQFAHLIKPEPAKHPSQRKGEGKGWL